MRTGVASTYRVNPPVIVRRQPIYIITTGRAGPLRPHHTPVHIILRHKGIIIRIEEKGSFASGSAQLTWEFEGLLLDMAEVLADMPGDLAIEGHTDNVPIRTERFYSNWDLSAARAAAVVARGPRSLSLIL